jgi:hypothetical protein
MEAWNKLPADKLPRTANGEAAFAASNTNIVIKGNNTWIVSGGMKARFSILQIKGILGKYTIQLYKESDDWHFTADFMTLRGFIGATMKR